MKKIFLRFKIGFSVFIFLLTINQVYCQTLQWRNLPNSPFSNTFRFEDIYFINPNTGWVISYVGKVFKTTDGGINGIQLLYLQEYNLGL